MGREQELRDAAKEGNLVKLETLLSVKKSALMSSFRKGININCQDENGNTALHLAALNGKREAVVYLLQNDASANIPDLLGNYPLHLAAFNGHHEVASILINQGPSRANVIEQNLAGDTALHIAAQYGHTQIVKILLECHADGNIRNKKEESPLDLAAMYGRISTVQVLVLSDPHLVRTSCDKHSPLHLSARNGHVTVIETLIDFGMQVNLMCDRGTALHEAALFGKIDSVRLLLIKGADVNARNADDLTVLDLLVDLPSERSQEITALIYEQSQSMPGAQTPRSKSMSFVGQNEDKGQDLRRPSRPADITEDMYSQVGGPQRSATVSERRPDRNPDYSCIEYPRISRLGSSLAEASISPLPVESNQDIFNDQFLREARPEMPSSDTGPPQKPKRTTLTTKTRSAALNAYEEFQIPGNNPGNNPAPAQQNQPLMDSVYDIVPPARPAAGSVTSQSSRNSIPPFPPPTSVQALQALRQLTEITERSYAEQQNNTKQKNNAKTEHVYLNTLPPSKPKRENPGKEIDRPNSSNSSTLSQFERMHLNMSPPLETSDTYENFIPPSMQAGDTRDNDKFTNTDPFGAYDNLNITNKAVVDDVYDNIHITNKAIDADKNTKNANTIPRSMPPTVDDTYDNIHITNKAINADHKTRHANTIPRSMAPTMSDTYDNVNITNKAIGNAMVNADTNTEISNNSNQPSMSRHPATSDTYDNFIAPGRQAGDTEKQWGDTYDNVRITNRASGNTNEAEKSIPEEKPRDLVSFETPVPPPRRASGVKQKRTRDSVKMVPAGNANAGSRPASTLNESYEWSKIDNIFSTLDDLIQADNEEVFDPTNLSEESLDSIGSWLTSLGLSQYEASFVANGYDDIRFIGGNMLDADDLREIGIQNNDHIRNILMSTAKLPCPARIGDEDFPVPSSVRDWLCKINLSDYHTRFLMNSYDSMDRVRVIWEFELTTVIGIHLHGHRKRMVHSLGHRPEQAREQISWSQKFAAAEAPKAAKSNSDDDAMDLANQLLKAAEDMVTGIEKRRDSKSDGKAASPPKAKSPTSPRSPASPAMLKYQPSFSWIHKPETLLYDSATYPTQYLGSHLVMVVRGTESTLDACKKLKSTSQMLQKIPTIQLSISVRGIDFIDAQSHSVISSYDIRNISYCAQDPGDLTVYAYITKDTRSNKHYCHVFKALNLTLADEIVLTIGQAFELAYHQHRILIEGAKQAKSVDEGSLMFAVQNRLNREERESEEQATNPPPMPRPYSMRKTSKEATKER